jgi:hypothetical protein
MIQNAIIDKTYLGIEEHGILTAFLWVKGDGWYQTFGGFALGGDNCDIDVCGFFIKRTLEIVGVERWEDLKDKAIRIEFTGSGIVGIGHIVRDIWYYPQSCKLLEAPVEGRDKC